MAPATAEFGMPACRIPSHRDLLVLAAIDLRRLDRLDEFDCLGNGFLELGNRCFRVGESRQLAGSAPVEAPTLN